MPYRKQTYLELINKIKPTAIKHGYDDAWKFVYEWYWKYGRNKLANAIGCCPDTITKTILPRLNIPKKKPGGSKSQNRKKVETCTKLCTRCKRRPRRNNDKHTLFCNKCVKYISYYDHPYENTNSAVF